jgi:hypothetical protein
MVTGVHEQSFIAHVMGFAACLGEYSKEPWPHCDRERNIHSFYSASSNSPAQRPTSSLAVVFASAATAALLALISS